MIKGLAHVCFRVADMEASLAFYQDCLGLRPGFDFTDEQGRRYGAYLFVGGRNFLELFASDIVTSAPGQSFQHFCLEVEDIQQTVRELRAHGIEVSEAKLGQDQSWQAWFSDPDGNRIELHEYTPASRQRGALEER